MGNEGVRSAPADPRVAGASADGQSGKMKSGLLRIVSLLSGLSLCVWAKGGRDLGTIAGLFADLPDVWNAVKPMFTVDTFFMVLGFVLISIAIAPH